MRVRAAPAAGESSTDAPPVQLAVALPTALPQASTGRATGLTTWLPLPAPNRPSVSLPDDPGAAMCRAAAYVAPPPPPPPPPLCTEEPPLQPAKARPTAATALPQMLTGTVIGATTWLPPPTPASPEVWLPPAPVPVLCTEEPPLQPAVASPKIATALPQTFSGAEMGAVIWLPPSTEALPEVRLPPAPPRPWLRTVAPPLQPASDLPISDTALPQALIGALMGMLTWLPPPTEALPEVLLGMPFLRLSTTVAPPCEEACAEPIAATELPLMSIGRLTGRSTWLPPRTDASPEVSARAVPLPANDMTATARRAAGVDALAHVRMMNAPSGSGGIPERIADVPRPW
ncbi:hypothetical protein MF672_009450 [Actinomadura sp. ATCC 31491]|uniref:Uncharacterized protein n=1 Tax=Actinomadura luzonensis TaxID=2805427 RepID=A0ABT0FNU1_9ACTN|nr:hypothetical protein [Actinomadura luzonensis]MCK2214014.1 hypothetical protein [Actinomadura luzonensis]